MFKKFSTLVLIATVLALVAVVAIPQAIAQDSGGIIVDATIGKGPSSLNPILCNDTSCARLIGFMFPGLLGVDSKTGTIQKGASGGLAKDWAISADNKVYTFKLRSDWKWTDGTPVTSKDILYGYQAGISKTSGSARVDLADVIDNVQAPDDTTVVVTFKGTACTALLNAASIPIAPAHALPSDFSKLKDDPFSTNPSVTAGVFKFGEFRPGERTTLVANQDYPDATNKKVVPDGYIQKIVPDQAVLIQQLLKGDINVQDNIPPASKADLRAAGKKGDVQIFDFPGNAWDYVGFNIADPKNPQPAVDKDGKPIDQGHHPLFGDVRVRKAIAQAIDVDVIIKGAVFNEGTRIVSASVPSSWAYPADIKPYSFDPVAAGKMLDDAGFPKGPDGMRVAKGAKYAPDGTPFKFTLLTNEGNTRRAAIATIVKDELKQIGIDVDFRTMESSAFFAEIAKQTDDAFVAGWRDGFPDDPDLIRQLFGPAADVPGAGNNFTSFSDPEFNDLIKKAQNLPGCDQTERGKLYHRALEILADQVPYVFLFAQGGMYVARSNVKGFGPYPNQMYWNVDTWKIQQ